MTIPPVASVTFLKFDPVVTSALAYYALVHFALAIPPALWLLTKADTLSNGALAAGCFYVALSLTNVGGILEGRRWVFAMEQARLVAMLVTAAALLVQGRDRLWLITLLTIGTASMAMLWRHRAEFVFDSDEAMDHAQRH